MVTMTTVMTPLRGADDDDNSRGNDGDNTGGGDKDIGAG